MTPLGTVALVIEEIPKRLLCDPSTSAPDFRLIAEKLEHAARQVRTLAECRPETFALRAGASSLSQGGVRGRS